VSVSDLLPASAFSAGRSGRRRAEQPAEDCADETSAAEARLGGSDGPEDGSVGQEQTADRADASSVTANLYPSFVQLPTELSGAAERPATGGVSSVDPVDRPPALPQFPTSEPPPAPKPRALDWELDSEDSTGEEKTQKMGLGDLLAEALAAYQESRDVRASAAHDDDGSTATDLETDRNVSRYCGLETRWSTGLALAPDPTDRQESDPSEALTNPLLRLPDLTTEPRWDPPDTGHRFAAGD